MPKGEATLPKLYTPVLGEKAHFDVQASALGDKASEVLKDLLQRLHNGEKINADRKLLRATASDYTEALQRGYGKKITDLDWDSPDFETLQNMTENVYQFAAAKNYHELRDLTDALRDGERIRSFEEFEQIAKPIIGKYNQHWLRTEYNQAVASAQAGSHWNNFKRHQKEMPFLRYQCVMDGNTRPDHAELDGTIKRIDDDFWTKYMPPNGWGCRCEAVQLPGSDYTETPDDQIKYPEVAEMFQVNFGQRGVAFPEGHAYFKQLPDEIWAQCKKEAKKARLAQIKIDANKLLKNKYVKVDKFDKKIGFTVRGIKEYLNQPHQDYMSKNEGLLSIHKQLKKSTYLGYLKKKKPTDRFTTHIFETQIKERKTWLLIRDYDNATNCSLYSISDNESILQHLIKEKS